MMAAEVYFSSQQCCLAPLIRNIICALLLKLSGKELFLLLLNHDNGKE